MTQQEMWDAAADWANEQHEPLSFPLTRHELFFVIDSIELVVDSTPAVRRDEAMQLIARLRSQVPPEFRAVDLSVRSPLAAEAATDVGDELEEDQ